MPNTCSPPPPGPDSIDQWPELLTIPEAAAMLRLSEHGLRNLLARGEIPGAVRFGRSWRISRRALERAVHGEVA